MAQSQERRKELAKLRYRRKQERKYIEERIKNTPPNKRYVKKTGYVVRYNSSIIKVTEVTDTCTWRSEIYKFKTKEPVQDSWLAVSQIFKTPEEAKEEYNQYLQREIDRLKREVEMLEQKKVK